MRSRFAARCDADASLDEVGAVDDAEIGTKHVDVTWIHQRTTHGRACCWAQSPRLATWHSHTTQCGHVAAGSAPQFQPREFSAMTGAEICCVRTLRP